MATDTTPVRATAEGTPSESALLEDYKLKIDFSLNQLNRLQTQFQVLLTVEIALLTAVIAARAGAFSQAAPWLALVGLAMSLGWFVLGAVGASRASGLRQDLEDAGFAWAAAAELPKSWTPVGHGKTGLRVARVGPLALTIIWLALSLLLLSV